MDEKSSYEKINYSLRPAKAIERKMFCQAIQKLSRFQDIENYRYIGFGSTFFCDFSLIHKTIGLKDLYSIEKDSENSERFNFNRPYSCIKTIFEHSNDALPSFDWKIPTILWLDYDSKLYSSILKDVNTFFSQAASGSMFIITINIKPEEEPKNKRLTSKQLKEYRIEQLIKRVGRNKLPNDIEKKNLGIVGNISTIHEILNDQINEVLTIRNGVIKEKSEELSYEQIFYFYYNDGTPMLTLGGIMFPEKKREAFDSAKFYELEFTRNGNESFKIEVPSLTFKEIYTLDKLLPDNINIKTGEINSKLKKKTNLPNLKNDDIIKYARIYRYFPTFAEANF